MYVNLRKCLSKVYPLFISIYTPSVYSSLCPRLCIISSTPPVGREYQGYTNEKQALTNRQIPRHIIVQKHHIGLADNSTIGRERRWLRYVKYLHGLPLLRLWVTQQNFPNYQFTMIILKKTNNAISLCNCMKIFSLLP